MTCLYKLLDTVTFNIIMIINDYTINFFSILASIYLSFLEARPLLTQPETSLHCHSFYFFVSVHTYHPHYVMQISSPAVSLFHSYRKFPFQNVLNETIFLKILLKDYETSCRRLLYSSLKTK